MRWRSQSMNIYFAVAQRPRWVCEMQFWRSFGRDICGIASFGTSTWLEAFVHCRCCKDSIPDGGPLEFEGSKAVPADCRICRDFGTPRRMSVGLWLERGIAGTRIYASLWNCLATSEICEPHGRGSGDFWWGSFLVRWWVGSKFTNGKISPHMVSFLEPQNPQVISKWVWVNTYRYIFSGMNIHKSQLFWGSPGVQGFDPSPNRPINLKSSPSKVSLERGGRRMIAWSQFYQTPSVYVRELRPVSPWWEPGDLPLAEALAVRDCVGGRCDKYHYYIIII